MMKKLFILFTFVALMLSLGCVNKPVVVPSNNTQITCSGAVCGSDGKTYDSDCSAQIAQITVLHSGACTDSNTSNTNHSQINDSTNSTQSSLTCVDEDGENFTKKASAYLAPNGDKKTDYCTSSGKLVEIVCSNNLIGEKQVSCGSDQTCQDGACIASSSSCIGSNSTNLSSRQTIKYNSTSYSDVCADIKSAIKYFCNDGQLASENKPCDPGQICNLGVCQEDKPKCTDSDGGKNTSARGKTISFRTITLLSDNTDECIDEGKVKEYYCLADGTTSEQDVLCPNGFKCANGACSIQSRCKKTDSTTSVTETTSDGKKTRTYDDRCLNNQTLQVYTCYGDSAQSNTVDCKCENDQCKK